MDISLRASGGAVEVNFDGLVGLTHSYAGLSFGNTASMANRAEVSNPREAALQGLNKAKALAGLGLVQAILPPQERPDIEALRRLGFGGTDVEVLRRAWTTQPEILAAVSSASSMWTANAATVCASADSTDRKVHFTAANLNQKFHRSIEALTTSRTLRAIFRDEHRFCHHDPLPSSDTFGDEGAANHTRLCADYGKPGLHIFVYGRSALDTSQSDLPRRFPARQTLEASEAIARLHCLTSANSIFVQQNPACIDAGAFHNDVVAVGNQNVLFYHECAFLNEADVISNVKDRMQKLCGAQLVPIRVTENDVSLIDAVKSYLFNSQVVSLAPGRMLLIAPQECRENPKVSAYIDKLIAAGNTPVREVRYFDVRQSMRNGGGPACLRLRVVLTDEERAKVNPHVFLTESSFKDLSGWVKKHYRDRLVPADLADPNLLAESRKALDELTQMLHLGAIYQFQM